VYSLVYGQAGDGVQWTARTQARDDRTRPGESRPRLRAGGVFKGENGLLGGDLRQAVRGSNFAPVFTSENADLSRVMVCKVSRQNTDDPGWESRSKPSFPPSSGPAGKKYEASARSTARSPLRPSEELKRDIAAQKEEEYATIFDKYSWQSRRVHAGKACAPHYGRVRWPRDNQKSRRLKRWNGAPHGVVYEKSNTRVPTVLETQIERPDAELALTVAVSLFRTLAR